MLFGHHDVHLPQEKLAMAALLESMNVNGPLGHHVANPVLQRFNRAVGLAALDQLNPDSPASQASGAGLIAQLCNNLVPSAS